MEHKEQTKLAAIVFTDIVGYTQKMDSDEMLTMTYLDIQREIVYPIVKDFGGKILKEIGDGLLIMFDSAAQAVRATIEIQTQLKGEAFQIRAGIHMGDVIMKDGDVFGAAVNIAARIEPQAEPGGICVSGIVSNQIRNRIDIQTVSIGVRELKGVKVPIEIFEVLLGDAQGKKVELTSFLKHLWQRRVPHISAIYGMLVLFTYFVLEYVSSNYFLSPHLMQFGTVLLLSLFPSVLIISYFHGRAASGEWKKIERFGLPINLVITGVILFSVFSDKDLGATTKSVNITDENGQTIERAITKSEFRKSMAIFFFENNTSDADLNWLQTAMPFMTSYDLLQDPYINSQGGFDMIQNILNEGYAYNQNLPLAAKEKIAKQRHLSYIVTGELVKPSSDAAFEANVQVRHTRNSKLVAENVFYGTSIFDLVDQISRQLKYDVKVPKGHIEDSKDYSIAEMLTNSMEAMESFTNALLQQLVFNDFAKAQRYGEEAIMIDPMFIYARAQVLNIYVSTSNQKMTDSTFSFVMQNLTVLPEQAQFQLKYMYYLLHKQDADKAFAVVKMWKELYPYEVNAYYQIASLYIQRDELNKAIAEYQEILILDPERYDCLINIADLYKQLANYDKALEYNSKYASVFPESVKPYLAIGSIYLILRDMEQSRANFEKVVLIEHDNIDALKGLISIDRIQGKYDKVEKQYDEILSLCKTSQDKVAVYGSISSLYTVRGQVNKALTAMNSQFLEMEKHTDPLNLIIQKALAVEKYAEAGKVKEAYQILEGFYEELAPPVNKLMSVGYLTIYLELDDLEKIEATIPQVQDAINTFQFNMLQFIVTISQAEIKVLSEDYKGAIIIYEEILKSKPLRASTTYKEIAVCYRKLKNFDKATENIQKALERSPFNPTFNLEMALIYADMDNVEKAKEHLKVSLRVWENADAVYKPAQIARDKYLELTQ